MFGRPEYDIYLKGSPFSPENMQRPRVVSLLTRGAMDEYRRAISGSDGVGAIIVHPYFEEEQGCIMTPSHYKYRDHLRRAVSRYQALRLPILILQEEGFMGNIDRNLEALGIDTGTVFVLPTDDMTPEPRAEHKKDLGAIVHDLRKAGLQKAVVAGSYLYKEGKRFLNKPFGVTPHRAYARNPLTGCVGYTIENLLIGGVRVVPGSAVFPRRI